MSLPRLDPDAATFPLPLAEVPFEASPVLADRWLAGLGDFSEATRACVEGGFLPPHALTGNTIYLVSSHYDIAGGVYWREQVTFHRPVKLGERLTIEGSVVGTYWRDGRRYSVMTSETLDAERRPVATSRSMGLLRYRRDATPPPDTEIPGGDAPGPDHGAATRNPHRSSLVALRVDAELDAASTVVTLEMMRALAGGEERNPIHTDEEAARQAGLSAPIAGGPHVLAFALETIMASLGHESLVHGANVDVRWVSPVAAGATVQPVVKVAGLDDSSVDLDTGVLCDGRPAMVGKITIPL